MTLLSEIIIVRFGHSTLEISHEEQGGPRGSQEKSQPRLKIREEKAIHFKRILTNATDWVH